MVRGIKMQSLGAQHWAILAVLAAGYFLPSFIAWGRNRAAAIFALNLVAGWTVIGWLAALVWACSAGRATAAK
jgi:Superinfection immunity protein